ncbi:MAG TPA: beta-propeller fold lactonase family protein [Actinomycetota bacterium]|nr:beta-propeller fold lactonase family protein [Actinomycetota bacterium]
MRHARSFERMISRIRGLVLLLVVALAAAACTTTRLSFIPEVPAEHEGRRAARFEAGEAGGSSQSHAHRTLDVYRSIETHRIARIARSFPERVYVPNSGSNTVDVIDPATYKIVRHFRVGDVPHHVTPSWDMRRLYVDNTGGDSLTVIDPATGRPVRKIHVRDPYNLYFTPDGSKAIVVAERYRRLDFRARRSWRLLKSVRIPSSGPDHLDFSAHGGFLLISAEYSGRVYRVNTRKMKVTGRAKVGGLPVDVKLAPDGSVFYVANQGLDGVSVIDAHTLKPRRFIHTGFGAHGLCLSRDGRQLYVSNRLAGSISVISLSTRRVVHTWHVGGSPDMMQVSPDGRRLWFSNRFNGSVGVADTRTGKLLHTIRVGSDPHGLTYFPQPGRFSIGHNGVYR